MDYIHRVVKLFGSYYIDMGLNSATTTGATDIVVVEQLDETLKCSPFHVRFGKLNLLRPKEVIVDIYVNNEYVKEVEMRVEPTGEAYFELQKAGSDIESPQSDSGENKFSKNRAKSGSPIRNNRSSPHSESEISIQSSPNNFGTDPSNDPGYRSCDETSFFECPWKRYKIFETLKMSLCGNLQSLNYDNTGSLDRFNRHMISFEDFIVEPSKILNDPNFVIMYDKNFIDWSTFSVILVAQLAFQKTLTVDSATKILKPKKIEKTSSYWFSSWRSSPTDRTSSKPVEEPKTEIKSSEDKSIKCETDDDNSMKQWVYNHRTRTFSGDIYLDSNNESINENCQNRRDSCSSSSRKISFAQDDMSIDTDKTRDMDLTNPINNESRSVDDSAVHFPVGGNSKSNILPSETLKLLKLKEGYNELVYVITGRYRGTIKVCCKIFLWKWSDRIVISDIDGTITKSDVLGHIYPKLGCDWTQPGIVQLYNGIQQNGYRILYLSARAIGQANSTQRFLSTVTQDNNNLPDGPLLLAPGSVFVAIRKEVIDKCPETFKISCLMDLKGLFPLSDNPLPLYAGFGNKLSDEKTYSTVGVPENRTFTVDSWGNLTSPGQLKNDDKDSDNQSSCSVHFPNSYEDMSKNLDLYFPPIFTDSNSEDLE